MTKTDAKIDLIQIADEVEHITKNTREQDSMIGGLIREDFGGGASAVIGLRKIIEYLE